MVSVYHCKWCGDGSIPSLVSTLVLTSSSVGQSMRLISAGSVVQTTLVNITFEFNSNKIKQNKIKKIVLWLTEEKENQFRDQE
jgi:hypothetical protein